MSCRSGRLQVAVLQEILRVVGQDELHPCTSSTAAVGGSSGRNKVPLQTLLSLLSRCAHPLQINQCQAHLLTTGHLSTTFLHNHLIRAHARTPTPLASIAVFAHLLRSDLAPDSHTFPALLKACSLIPSPPHGLSAHAQILKSGFSAYLYVNNALIHFLSVIGDLAGARRLLEEGGGGSRGGSAGVDVVSYNTMISGYVRGGDLVSARELFDAMPVRDEVSWSAMIAGYVQAGMSKEGLAIFGEMQDEGVSPGQATLVSVLAACAHLGELEQGKWVHGYLRTRGFGINVYVGTALIDMYCKCGEVALGLEVFDEMLEKNLLAWTTIIKGLAMHGRGVEALNLFHEMEKNSGLVPDDIAFLGALCACTHAGLVDEGWRIFHSMSTVYGIKPKLEHYGCMADLLARNGLFYDAMTLVQSMPMEADALIWGAIMAGCKLHGNVELAEVAVKHLIKLEPDHSGVYVLLANIYSSSGRHEDARNVRLLMRTRGMEKTPGCSLIELEGTVHQFLVGDTSHPQMDEILSKWEEIDRLIRLEGYVPDKREVLLDVEDEEKEEMLSHHSEKLAIAFALLNTSPGMTIRVVKNLRVCSDCHHVAKFISKLYDRKIIVRDRTRFHIFQNGSCNCNDYW